MFNLNGYDELLDQLQELEESKDELECKLNEAESSSDLLWIEEVMDSLEHVNILIEELLDKLSLFRAKETENKHLEYWREQ